MTDQLLNNSITIMHRTLFEKELHHIVLYRSLNKDMLVSEKGITYSVLILHEICGACMQFAQKWPGEFRFDMFEASLQNTATVGMRRQFEHITLESGNED
jgi:hypothetical protein